MIFPKHDQSVDPRLVFVAMPFAPSFNVLYESIEGLVQDYCHLRCWRADSESAGSRIMSDVWRATNDAIVVIADLSGGNANVFYEVGLAHAIGKPVVLLTSDRNGVPFDVHGIRAIRYDLAEGFRVLRKHLLSAMRTSVVTLPDRWRVEPRPDGAAPALRITHVNHPKNVVAGQPFEILVRARNEGQVSLEGYFSVSFPEAVDVSDVEILQTDIGQQLGGPRHPWCSGRVILEYPIAEAYAIHWEASQEHLIKVRARSHREGWLPFFVNASWSLEPRAFNYDPRPGVPHTDQRGEPVYCGILDVLAA
ncbi:MAG: hypothetical protein HUU55_18640 [Myxococcales bacterium]|nr:hypothetical protein [Myxococcales bacterium]